MLHENSDKKMFEIELEAEKLKLRHKYIMRIYDSGISNLKKNGEIHSKRMYVASEYCPNGDMNNFILKAGRLPEQIALFMFKKIIEGVAYLHDKGIAHRDLKPENILLTRKCVPKIGDFGLLKKTKSLAMEKI